jgi:hypothetical protein
MTGWFSTVVERLRNKFTDAGFPVSPRDDVGVAAVCWYFGKKEQTLANWRSAGKGPRWFRNGTVRYPLEGLLEYERKQIENAA